MIPERAVLLQGKHIDQTPDITSDEYWDTHHIAVVRVTDVVPRDASHDDIKYRVLMRITDAAVEEERTTPRGHWWFGETYPAAPPMAPGATYVVFYRREGPTGIAAIPLDQPPEQSALVTRLRRIAALRAGGGGRAALLEAVFDADGEVALYALRHLLGEPSAEPDAAFLKRLRALRDDAETDPERRLLAARLLARGGPPGGPDDEYAWLKRSLSSPGAHDWTRLRLLVLRMLDFADEREDAARFLTGLVRDSGMPQDARTAAYSVLEDPRLVRPAAPDDVSNLVFDTVEWMVGSSEGFLRHAGALLLHNVSRGIGGGGEGPQAKRARASLQKALAAESDPATQQVMRHALDLLSPKTGR